MKKIIRGAVAIGLTALLSTCILYQKYELPDNVAEKASIRFVSLYSGNAEKVEFSGVYQVVKKKCSKHALVGTISGLQWIANLGSGEHFYAPSRNYLGLPLSENLNEQDYTEIKIAVGSKFTMLMDSVRSKTIGYQYTVTTASWCKAQLSFIPKSNTTYEAIYEYDDFSCKARIFEVKSNYGIYYKIPEVSQVTENSNCSYEI